MATVCIMFGQSHPRQRGWFENAPKRFLSSRHGLLPCMLQAPQYLRCPKNPRPSSCCFFKLKNWIFELMGVYLKIPDHQNPMVYLILSYFPFNQMVIDGFGRFTDLGTPLNLHADRPAKWRRNWAVTDPAAEGRWQGQRVVGWMGICRKPPYFWLKNMVVCR